MCLGKRRKWNNSTAVNYGGNTPTTTKKKIKQWGMYGYHLGHIYISLDILPPSYILLSSHDWLITILTNPCYNMPQLDNKLAFIL